MQYRFPDNFWWGSASSAAQAEGASLEGGKAPTTWTTGSRCSRTASIRASGRPTPPASIATTVTTLR